MTSRFKKSHIKDDEHCKEKNHEVNSSKDTLDEEIILVKRKLEAEKARKRIRGPYRKSLAN
jgi:hypothetical protein